MAKKERSKYEENQREFTKYADSELQQQKTLIDSESNPDMYYYWERESDIRLRLREGYEVVQNLDGEMSLYAQKSQDPTNNGSCYRLPTQDSNEDLILLQIPKSVREKYVKQREARTDFLEKQMDPKNSKWETNGDSWELHTTKTISK